MKRSSKDGPEGDQVGVVDIAEPVASTVTRRPFLKTLRHEC